MGWNLRRFNRIRSDYYVVFSDAGSLQMPFAWHHHVDPENPPPVAWNADSSNDFPAQQEDSPFHLRLLVLAGGGKAGRNSGGELYFERTDLSGRILANKR